MNANVTTSTLQLLKLFPDQESARAYLENRLWPKGAICPTCGSRDRVTVRKDGFYRCNPCKIDFTIRTGTIFERSHVPLHKWIYAMYLLVTSHNGISSMQLSKEIGITQKSAWFVLQRLREACGNDLTILRGIVEIDETPVVGKERNKHGKRKLHAGRGTVGKRVGVGLRERDWRTIAKHVDMADTATPHAEVHHNIEAGSVPHTNAHVDHNRLDGIFYRHEANNCSVGECARGGGNTNRIESVWVLMRHGLHAAYHHASAEPLNRHVNEFTFSHDQDNVKRRTMERLDSFISATAGCHLKSQELTT